MYNNRFFCITLLTVIFSIGIMLHTAEAEPMTLSSTTDIYYLGDYIVFFGEVETDMGSASTVSMIKSIENMTVSRLRQKNILLCMSSLNLNSIFPLLI